MGKTKRCLLDLLLAALCVGLGLLLPGAFRWVENGEQVLLLLQLPVLLCGLLCGPAYGLSCGLLIPLLPQLFSGAPEGLLSISLLWELAIYGFLAGLLTALLAAGAERECFPAGDHAVGPGLLRPAGCLCLCAGLYLEPVGAGVLCPLPAGHCASGSVAPFDHPSAAPLRSGVQAVKELPHIA